MSEEYPDEFMDESQIPLDVMDYPPELNIDVMDDSQDPNLDELDNDEFEIAEGLDMSGVNESEERAEAQPEIKPLEGLPCSPAPPASIKLFIARIPRDHKEEDIRKLFEEFGTVEDVTIIKDKATNVPKNCAFVKMASICQADAAIRSLNNQHTVEPGLGAVQIRYATGEPERLGFTQMVGEPGVDTAKLFVGSLPRSFSEQDLQDLFKDYGDAVETFLMKDMNSGGNKGCGFVRMRYKEQALYAIRELDHKKMVKDSVKPIEVRFAQSKNAAPQDPRLMQRIKRPPPPLDGIFPNYGPGGNFNGGYGKLKKRKKNGASLGYMSYNNGNPRHAGAWREYISPDGRFYYFNVETGSTQWEVPRDFLKLSGHGAGFGGYNNGGYAPAGNPASSPGFNAVTDDSCLFVFHIPSQWNNSDLFRTFSPFGRVVKAKIVFDRATNRSKGYAFVSYDNPDSATQAVANMNGFSILGKKLKSSAFLLTCWLGQWDCGPAVEPGGLKIRPPTGPLGRVSSGPETTANSAGAAHTVHSLPSVGSLYVERTVHYRLTLLRRRFASGWALSQRPLLPTCNSIITPPIATYLTRIYTNLVPIYSYHLFCFMPPVLYAY
ncbi:ribonucleoprotein [Theileria orientalis strain Shintoku]|uniref:Ribonucleoprotein n=1 Tax=Theileria orientalis strain Shintoku TaxID=869250 RepID=J4C7F9_THEOR|nr:ribonucleoprotein [Theileria orientalis strain Shintoku]BAM38968.1 ribonucleoprotein [Theileria orientalis strain Shintoku]|eukprot:XP_009689269.1 ribonucleoprotein [Theileria orientalis strain Shintoku]